MSDRLLHDLRKQCSDMLELIDDALKEKKTLQKPKRVIPGSISDDQHEEMQNELKNYPEIAVQILKKLKIESLSELPRSAYRSTMDQVRRIIRAHNK